MTYSACWNIYLPLPGERKRQSKFRVPSKRELDQEDYWIQRFFDITGSDRDWGWVFAEGIFCRAGFALLHVLVFLLRVARVIAIVTPHNRNDNH